MTSTQPFDKLVNLKLLYTFDDQNTYLARSSSPVSARIITLPNQPPHNGMQVGCIDLKFCLNLLSSISPEFFQKHMDYSIYYKDMIEVDQPYVASGLCSNILNSNSSNIIITGTLSANFMSLYQNNSTNGGNNNSSNSNNPNLVTDTLDIKLRLSPLSNPIKRKHTDMFSYNDTTNNNSSNNIIPASNTHFYQNNNTPMLNNDLTTPQSQQPRKRSKKMPIANPIINKTIPNLPQLASRTQSLPFITEDSLAHRIRLSDMMNNKIDEEIDSNGQPISSRFSNFHSDKLQNLDNQPTKAKKSKSFIQSVVKIGNKPLNKKASSSISSSSTSSPKRCINCCSSNNPPFKFFKDGIFELANSGYLCSICTSFQSKNDIKQLRERGQLGSKGLLDGPYSSNLTNNGKFTKRSKKKLNANTSLIIDNSSSPLFSSSPVNLQSGFSGSMLNNVVGSYSKGKRFNKQYQTIHEGMNNEDLLDLLKLDSNFNNHNNNNHVDMNNLDLMNIHLNNGLEPIEDIFRLSDHKFTSSSPSSSKGQSKNNTPDDNDSNYYKDVDNMPVDATKLNTTLIPLDDDDKENFPPSNTVSVMPPPSSLLYSKMDKPNVNHNENSFISPSIQRIIESFSNEPTSPTKTTGNDEWNYDFFEEDNSSQVMGNDNTKTNNSKNCDDPEINRILAQSDKYDITPKDPGTGQTQQNGDSPNGFKMTRRDSNTIDIKTDVMDPSEADHENNNSKSTFLKTPNNNKKNEPFTYKKARLPMPSSPFFQLTHDEELGKEEKTLDTTLNSMVNWDAKSSPITDPLYSTDSGK